MEMTKFMKKKLLGLKIRNDLTWKSNTEMLTKKAYMAGTHQDGNPY